MKGTLKIFDRHEKCIGIRLWKSRTRFVQLWYCPRGYEVKPHSHNDQHIELMYVFGKTTFFRMAKTLGVNAYNPKWYNIFKRFTVSAGQIHWFEVTTWPLIFINFATFVDGKEPTSAAIDFHPTT